MIFQFCFKYLINWCLCSYLIHLLSFVKAVLSSWMCCFYVLKINFFIAGYVGEEPRSAHNAGRWEHYPYLLLSHYGKYLWKKWIKIILITKEIAHKLNKQYGVPFGENGISTSKTRYKKYYLCESSKNKEFLSKVMAEKFGN